MRQQARERGARRVATARQVTQGRASQRGHGTRDGAKIGIGRVALGCITEEQQTTRPVQKRRGNATVRIGRHRGIREDRRDALPNRFGNGTADGRQCRHHLVRIRRRIRGYREAIIQALGVQESDLGLMVRRGLADAVREDRRFAAQIRAHDQNTIEGIDIGER